MNVANEMLDRLCARERYQELLAELTPASLAVVALVMEDGLSLREVADLLGISRGAAAMRLSLARGHLIARHPELKGYHSHGIKVGICGLCGKVIAKNSRWCKPCWNTVQRALAAAERGDFG